MLPIQRFIDFSQKNQLFSTNDKILLAVSGGKDSVLMAHFFKQSGISFALAHCNFQLRGEEAERDEKFVENLSKQLSVSIFIKRFDTAKIAATNKTSIQLTARELRYTWFEEICEANDFQKIATAHHQNDNAETLFFNLSRGCGLNGLHGILPKNDRIIRPLLFLSQNEINELITLEKIEYVEDSSNKLEKYSRNFIRHQLIPTFEKMNDQAIQHLSQTINYIIDYEQIINDFIKQNHSKWMAEIGKNVWHIYPKALKKVTYATTLLFELLKDFGFSGSQCETMVNQKHQSGNQFFSAHFQLSIDREIWILEKIQANAKTAVFVNTTTNSIIFNEKKINFHFSEDITISYQKNIIHLDAEKLKFPLEIRSWQDGDKIKPLGMNGFKKLSDIFIDLKIPLSVKKQIPILVNNDGKIVALIGEIISEDFKITLNTKKMLILDLES